MFLGGLAGDSAGFDGVSCKVLDSAEPMNAVQSQQSIHVLLVDDDTLARHVVRKALEKFGYQGVMPCSCGIKIHGTSFSLAPQLFSTHLPQGTSAKIAKHFQLPLFECAWMCCYIAVRLLRSGACVA